MDKHFLNNTTELLSSEDDKCEFFDNLLSISYRVDSKIGKFSTTYYLENKT